MKELETFFADCIGKWTSERTYHYLYQQEVERSRTTFDARALSVDYKNKVLQDNHYQAPPNLDSLPGFSLSFYTISEKGEEVQQSLNLLFVPSIETKSYIEGDYLRDRAYEEARPIVSKFRFDPQERQLLMTTNYTNTVSLDSITFLNPDLRVRRIINYKRPAEGEKLEIVTLVGFGLEQRILTNYSNCQSN